MLGAHYSTIQNLRAFQNSTTSIDYHAIKSHSILVAKALTTYWTAQLPVHTAKLPSPYPSSLVIYRRNSD